MTQAITTKVYGLIRRHHEILVERIHEADGTLKCYRPLGGTLNFGEMTSDGIRREMREELGTDIDIISLYCVAEEIYSYRSKAGHQIAFVYEVVPSDTSFYEQSNVVRTDHDPLVHPDKRITIQAEWIDPKNIPHGVSLVPDDLAVKLKQE